ncbi:MAG: alpha/beta hydrolase [Roseovarius sp.]
MIDWTDAFDNMGYVPGAGELPARWAAAAEAFRQGWQAKRLLDENVSYGPGPREKLDIFRPEGASAGLVTFVHGGYWVRLDKSYWSHLAAGCLAEGWSVAMPSYPLAPSARIHEITACVARAVEKAAEEVPGPIRLMGHSAGGHLVSRMMCAGVLPEPVAARLARVTSISGLHQLAPLMEAKMNADLRLDAAEAEAESPALQTPLNVPFTAWVGAQERPEFLRQTRLIEEVWGLKGADVHAVYDPGHNHFSVIEALAEPASPLVAEVLR